MSDNTLSFIPPTVLDMIPEDVRRTIRAKLGPRSQPTPLGYPFPEPTAPDHTPLVQHAGFDYICTGCGGRIPDGSVLHETVVDGMVVGLSVTAGHGGSVIHECGRGR